MSIWAAAAAARSPDAHALRRREALALDELEQFDARSGVRAHLISVGVGCLSIALCFQTGRPGTAGLVYFLMGPLHGFYGWRRGVARALEARRLSEGESLKTRSSP